MVGAAALALVLCGLVGRTVAGAAGSPALAWSPDAALLGGRKGAYLDDAAGRGGVPALLGALQADVRAEAQAALTFVIVSETLSQPALAARPLAWLKQAHQAAPASVVVPNFVAGSVGGPALSGATLFDGNIAAQADAVLAQCAKVADAPQTVVVKVASLANGPTGTSSSLAHVHTSAFSH